MSDSRKMLLRRVHFTHMKMLPREGCHADPRADDGERTCVPYLKLMKVRYVAGKRVERSRLLTEMQEVTSLHRKSLTRLMHTASLERTKRQKLRPRTYGPEVERVVVRVWESRDYICAERLTPGLLRMARHLARFEPLGLTAQVEGQLATISRATVARILGKYRSRMRRLPQKGAERANQVTKGVPMGRMPWDISDPGHFEVDLVHHNGESSAGLYGHTIQLVDVATGWSERVAVMGRGQRAMEAGFRRIVERLPFPIRELHPDNGSEFFNQHLVHFWKDKVVGVQLSRSRPYQKNDNRIVEQKNDTLVRKSRGAPAPGQPGAGGGTQCPLRADVALLPSLSTRAASLRENRGRWQGASQVG
jgi:hypothetical protein